MGINGCKHDSSDEDEIAVVRRNSSVLSDVSLLLENHSDHNDVNVESILYCSSQPRNIKSSVEDESATVIPTADTIDATYVPHLSASFDDSRWNSSFEASFADSSGIHQSVLSSVGDGYDGKDRTDGNDCGQQIDSNRLTKVVVIDFSLLLDRRSTSPVVCSAVVVKRIGGLHSRYPFNSGVIITSKRSARSVRRFGKHRTIINRRLVAAFRIAMMKHRGLYFNPDNHASAQRIIFQSSTQTNNSEKNSGATSDLLDFDPAVHIIYNNPSAHIKGLSESAPARIMTDKASRANTSAKEANSSKESTEYASTPGRASTTLSQMSQITLRCTSDGGQYPAAAAPVAVPSSSKNQVEGTDSTATTPSSTENINIAPRLATSSFKEDLIRICSQHEQHRSNALEENSPDYAPATPTFGSDRGVEVCSTSHTNNFTNTGFSNISTTASLTSASRPSSADKKNSSLRAVCRKLSFKCSSARTSSSSSNDASSSNCTTPPRTTPRTDAMENSTKSCHAKSSSYSAKSSSYSASGQRSHSELVRVYL